MPSVHFQAEVARCMSYWICKCKVNFTLDLILNMAGLCIGSHYKYVLCVFWFLPYYPLWLYLVKGQRGIALKAVHIRTLHSIFMLHGGDVFVCCSISDLVILFYVLYVLCMGGSFIPVVICILLRRHIEYMKAGHCHTVIRAWSVLTKCLWLSLKYLSRKWYYMQVWNVTIFIKALHLKGQSTPK